MAVLRNSVVIRCTPEEAFDYLSDLRSEAEWNPNCEQVEKVTPGPIDVGTTFRAKWKHGPTIEPRITAYERPSRWSAHNDGPLEVTFTGSVEEVPGGARVSAELAPRPHGWFRVFFPILLVSLRRQQRQHMDYLREALEARSRPIAG